MIFTGISMVYQFIVLMLKYYYKEILRLDEISLNSGKLVPELNFGILDFSKKGGGEAVNMLMGSLNNI